jgi:adenylate cyclase
MASGRTAEEELRLFFTGEHPKLEKSRRMLRLLPASPRCRVCFAPFGNIGGALLRPMGFERWGKNPNICQRCIVELGQVDTRGTEVEITMLFADVRESTKLAGEMSSAEFSRLMNRFFGVATDILLEAEALIDKFVGDEVVALFVPVVAGPEHARRAVDAARALLRETGHGGEPWVPLGIGVHTGRVFLGMVGEGKVSDFTAMGDNVNLTARLSGAARAGEILVTDATRDAAVAVREAVERRTLQLKGIREPVEVSVLTTAEPLPPSSGPARRGGAARRAPGARSRAR